jgi:hypothetical protein
MIEHDFRRRHFIMPITEIKQITVRTISGIVARTLRPARKVNDNKKKKIS